MRQVELLIDDAVAGEAVLGLRRPDLPPDARPGHAGWRVDLNVRDLAEGPHRLTARAYDNAGGSVLLDRSASILVTRNRGAPEGAVESIRDAVTGAAGSAPQYGVLRIDGWAIDEEQGAPVDRVIVSLDGEPRTAASLDFPQNRIDPAARTNGDLDAPPADASDATRAALSQHGRWSAWLDIGAASPGPHQVTVAAFDSGGKTTPLGPDLIVDVTPAPPPGAARLASAIQPPPLSRDPPLTDEYIWSDQASSRDVARYFRRRFVVDRVPPAATLMVSGPDVLDVFLNGERVMRGRRDPSAIAPGHLLTGEVTSRLRTGQNVLAIRAAGGDRVAAVIVAGRPGALGERLVSTGPGWRAHAGDAAGWERADFDDGGWREAVRIGTLDAAPRALEVNTDVKLHGWPGYRGISPELGAREVYARLVRDIRPRGTRLENLESLTGRRAGGRFTIAVPADAAAAATAPPSLLLDFGRVLAGRLQLSSATSAPIVVRVEMGESAEEALHQPYLGPVEITIPANGTAFGPKSAFRFARLSFVAGPARMEFDGIRAQESGRPVALRGSFESSDRLLDDIWMTGAYTAALAMQERFWDAPKRDREAFAGDLHVAARATQAAFGETTLALRSLEQLADIAIRDQADVNTIPGYNAFWVLSLADLYRFTGDAAILERMRPRLEYVLTRMLGWLGADGRFDNPQRARLFVDWSPGLDADTPEARVATHLEFCLALAEGARLLRVTGAGPLADRAASAAEAATRASRDSLRAAESPTFGLRWQPNAFAVFSGLFDAAADAAIGDRILGREPTQPITPYYLYYALEALSRLDARSRALSLIRSRWGAMLRLGATSFWEVYDPSWPALDFHRALRVNTSGYFVSLAHAWSAGPTAWLSDHVLGIRPASAGWREATIEPDLLDLEWVRGSRPVGGGAIGVGYRRTPYFSADIELPPGTVAEVLVPLLAGANAVVVDGREEAGESIEGGRRVRVRLNRPGRHRIDTRR